ncbi:MAG: DUF885 domain-containing protein [Gemmatimonadetes bacterium]|uniref:DUF885 domain-containing protein n=1 Tax=Candidatus Kutchimonas denitrificans TaxID=3056748 RepID=A0AAE4ZAZ8_9BACT|nr:DUF885 domain-containing protein [Gemmatimonadota bacterium]NIR76684.1 DUF885 domain-containing protein [Candidatus Kutchimonas denitrificans]NIS01171.1 DUF885 domain-containing protein [Gemmatimonadota bacterium]NIT68210.1 DUF885 domain-containing protein [Gemmatimonadota bacterium]NIW75428.1 DUF885 family protein [Gemmatimonadota bacterium]
MCRQTVAACVVALAALAAVIPGHPADATGQAHLDADSELKETVRLYATDRAALLRRYDVEYSTVRRTRMREFYDDWKARLDRIDFDALSQEGRIDHVLLAHEVRYERSRLNREERLLQEMAPWLPFASSIAGLQEARRRMEPVDPPRVAATLAELARQVDSVRTHRAETWRADSGAGAGAADRTRVVARRAAGLLDELQETLEDWYGFYAGYDPLFTWWAEAPYARLDEAISDYLAFLREDVVGIRTGAPEPLIGDPIGADGLRADLAHEMIPYTVEELIAIGEREFAWCEEEFRRAANEMGFGDDWKAALEQVKRSYVPPGDQPQLVRELAEQSLAFVKERDLLTVPPLAEEVWRMRMLSPERQRVAPFFLGGEVMWVAYPTEEMAHADKLMSMRGNNPHFSRATVHHEYIPGHHLQGFMTARYNSHRRVFSTPFWTEGWALYWEMLLWDLGFPRSPEDRIGMLFWRAHRAARIIFSLRFHLGTMTAEEAVDFLVERVGHERANAEAEVRRSIAGDYSPLYQAAYMLGGLQFRALHRELVESGEMTDREFHDAVLHGGPMPVELVRARLTAATLERAGESRWRFAGDPVGR